MSKSHTKAGQSGDDAEADAQAEAMESTLAKINKIGPGVGDAIAAAFAGPLGPVMRLGMAIQQVQTCLSDYKEELDKEADAAYQPQIEAVKRLQSAWENAAGADGEYLAKLARAGEDDNPAKNEIDRTSKVAVGELGEPKQILEARAKSAIERLKASGTPRDGMAADDGQQPLDAIQSANEKAGGSSSLNVGQSEGEKNVGKPEDNAIRTLATDRTGDYPLDSEQALLQEKAAAQKLLAGNEAQRVRAEPDAGASAAKTAGAAEANLARPVQLPAEIVQDQRKDDIHEHARKVIDALNSHGGKLNESLGRLAAETGRTQQQTLAIVESIIAGQGTIQRRMAQLEAQLAATNHLHHSG